jgi:Rrf2 family protein
MSLKLSTKTRYGTRAIIEIAKSYGKNPVKREDISKKEKVSKTYLENILIALKTHGIIDTQRGANGGYRLAKPPSEITMLDIVNALEGSISPVECLEQNVKCNMLPKCKTRKVWQKLMEAQKEVLCSITLEDIIKDEEQKYIDFSI